MSSRTFSETNTGDNGWSKPVMISGENGKPGVDGAGLGNLYITSINKTKYTD